MYSRCIPKYRVCLSDSSDCPQYECVGRPAACDKNSVEPACDTDGLVHPSLCQLQQAGKTLAYMGHCQVCQTRKQHTAALRSSSLQTLMALQSTNHLFYHVQPSGLLKLKSTQQSADLHLSVIILRISCYLQSQHSIRGAKVTEGSTCTTAV